MVMGFLYSGFFRVVENVSTEAKSFLCSDIQLETRLDSWLQRKILGSLLSNTELKEKIITLNMFSDNKADPVLQSTLGTGHEHVHPDLSAFY